MADNVALLAHCGGMGGLQEGAPLAIEQQDCTRHASLGRRLVLAVLTAQSREPDMPVDTQDLDKKDAVAEKQRESMMVGLSKTKTELGSLQDALAKTQVELEKTNFELHAKKSKHMSHVLVMPYCAPGAQPQQPRLGGAVAPAGAVKS